jgi:peptidoglycan/LPS O-acetylase OafA/YrhL
MFASGVQLQEKGFTLFAVLFILCSAMNQSGFFVSRFASMKALILLAPYSFAAYIFQVRLYSISTRCVVNQRLCASQSFYIVYGSK